MRLSEVVKVLNDHLNDNGDCEAEILGAFGYDCEWSENIEIDRKKNGTIYISGEMS